MGKVNVIKRGNVYQYKFEIAPVDGKRKFKNKSGFLSKNEALKAGIKAYSEYMNTGHAFTPNEISYSDYLDYWMKEHCEVNLKYHTIEAYKSIIRIHVKPKIGHYKLATITTATLQEFVNKVYLDGSELKGKDDIKYSGLGLKCNISLFEDDDSDFYICNDASIKYCF